MHVRLSGLRESKHHFERFRSTTEIRELLTGPELDDQKPGCYGQWNSKDGTKESENLLRTLISDLGRLSKMAERILKVREPPNVSAITTPTPDSIDSVKE